MKYLVKVKTHAGQTKVEKLPGNSFLVSVPAAPVKGKANQAVIKALAEYLGIAKSRFRIVAGHKIKQKLVEIL